MKQLISILGSTGSVGLNTLEIIDKKKYLFKPFIFSANKNYDLICKQIIKYKPNFFIINDKEIYKKVKKKFTNLKVKILENYDNLDVSLPVRLTGGGENSQSQSFIISKDDIPRTEDEFTAMIMFFENFRQNCGKNYDFA